jgi:endo-1,3(4)-beta-glucanase
MLPINPSSAFTRTARFIREEWEAYFDADGCTPVTTVAGGWRGILYANLAIINPKASWEFFAQPNFDPNWLDGGASRTWYLAYAAGELFDFILGFRPLSKALPLHHQPRTITDHHVVVAAMGGV